MSNRYELRSKSISIKPAVQHKRSRSGPRCRFPKFNPNIGFEYNQRKQSHPNPDPENIPTLEHEGMKRRSTKFANAALSYLAQQGHNYNLVLADYYEAGVVSGGVRFHHNFKAKRPTDPPELTETFFSQLYYHRNRDLALCDLTVECCVSLGRSDALPKKLDNYGCGYCSKYTYHPENGCDGLIWARTGPGIRCDGVIGSGGVYQRI